MANTRECHAHANVPIGDGAWRSGTTALVTQVHTRIGPLAEPSRNAAWGRCAVSVGSAAA